jgi:hypothetical protein
MKTASRATKRTIDSEKLGRALRKMTRRDLLVAIDRALVHVPKHRLHEIVEGFVTFDDLVATRGKRRTRVIDKVKAFDDASRRGEYYEWFAVNSKNFMEKSEGTTEWIAECQRLFGDVLGLDADGDPRQEQRVGDRLIPVGRGRRVAGSNPGPARFGTRASTDGCTSPARPTRMTSHTTMLSLGHVM